MLLPAIEGAPRRCVRRALLVAVPPRRDRVAGGRLGDPDAGHHVARGDLGARRADALFAAADEFMTAFTMRSWRWLHGIFAVLFLLGGIYALLRPLDTFLALAALVELVPALSGTFQIVTALSVHGAMPLWWIGLVAGIVEVLIGFWAIGCRSLDRLLIIWVGILALMRGITEIVTAFQLKRVKDEFGSGGAPLPPRSGGSG